MGVNEAIGDVGVMSNRITQVVEDILAVVRQHGVEEAGEVHEAVREDGRENKPNQEMAEKESHSVGDGEERNREVGSDVLRVAGVGEEEGVIVVEHLHVEDAQEEENDLEDQHPRDDATGGIQLGAAAESDGVKQEEAEHVIAHAYTSLPRWNEYASPRERR